ncbi:MAG TPA: hypothetical protein VFN82_02370 [Solirubrobacterales bacterium]|nr:hypothetical protein [Solirubrobacterales bacterium]
MAVAAPARRTAPAPGPSRTAPPPKRKAPARRPPVRRTPPKATPRGRIAAGGQLIPLAVGRTAVAVTQLPDSGLVVRMTRGRAWIAVLGLLLVGIVALNVATLSFAASSGRLDNEITALESENTMLESRAAERYGTSRVRGEAAQLGLVMPTAEEPVLLEAHRGDAAAAAQRLAASGG